ncbi:MAG: AAA family ATPase [Phycisphaera sp.]|nr:MAG: AAA family ATPase [Phycisphaera sp.]
MSSHQDPHLDAWMETEEPQEQGHTINPVLLVHRALRGRYLLAIVIGVVLAIPGALVGYKLMPPVYTSMGIINIDPAGRRLIYTNEFTEKIASFESYVRSQATMVESPRVLQDAATKLAEQSLLPPDPGNWIRLQRATTVSVPKGGREIYVRVTMADPRLAKDVAQTILTSYESIATDEASDFWDDQEYAIEQIASTTRSDRDSYLRSARELAEARGLVDLERRRMFVQSQVETLEKQIQALEIEVPTLLQERPEDDADVPVRDLTPEDYALVDSHMNGLVGRRRSIEQDMSALLSRVTEIHPDYLDYEAQLAAVQLSIDEHMAFLKESGLEMPTGGTGLGGARQRYDALRAIRASLANEAKELSEIALDIQAFEAEAQAAQDRLDLANSRLESLRTERQNSTEGRISIAQQAEVPYQPSEDRRRPLAAMGALGGMGFSVAAFAVYGLLHPRYRYVADLEEEAAAPPVLGLVPQVADGRIEADEAAQAGVHQIRSLLESVPHVGNARVIVVTSATAAEGKSTLAAALAASMSRAGRKTLLIDADLIGRGVTSRLSARRLSGLSDRVASAHDNGQIHEVEGRSNLDLMPAGVAEGFDAEQLSSQAMEELLASLRPRYDAIVIDTGPILGSLEANAVVPHADQIVLVVSRGQNTRLVKVAIDRLHRFHAGRIGMVFNRAARGDIERSTSAASISVRSRAASRPDAEQARSMSASV